MNSMYRRGWAVSLAAGLVVAGAAQAQEFRVLRNASGVRNQTAGVGVSADGGWIVGISSSLPAYWDVLTDEPATYLSGVGGDRTLALKVSSDGAFFSGVRLQSGVTDPWRCPRGEPCELPIPGAPMSWATTQAMSGDGSTFLYIYDAPGGVKNIGWFRVGQPAQEFALNSEWIFDAISSSGDVAFFMTTVGFYRYQAGDSEPVHIGDLHPFPRSMSCSADGSTLFFDTGGVLMRWSQTEGFVPIPGCCEGDVKAISRDGRHVVGNDYNRGAAWVWNQFTGKRYLAPIFPGLNSIGTAFPNAISDDGRVIVGASFGVRGWVGTLPPSCQADYTLDGNLDQNDIAELIDLLAGGANPRLLPVDFNRDGSGDYDDLVALIGVVAGQPCP